MRRGQTMLVTHLYYLRISAAKKEQMQENLALCFYYCHQSIHPSLSPPCQANRGPQNDKKGRGAKQARLNSTLRIYSIVNGGGKELCCYFRREEEEEKLERRRKQWMHPPGRQAGRSGSGGVIATAAHADGLGGMDNRS